mgnify:CR=1 FL=1
MFYASFDDWYHEIEGFALRAERLTSPIDELRAAFEAGRAAGETCHKCLSAYGSIGNLPNSRLGPSDHSVHEGQCRMCLERTKDWTGAGPVCVFEADWKKNWNCATLNAIRNIVWEGNKESPPGVKYEYCNDQKYATVRVDECLEWSNQDGYPMCLWVSWYKNRGSTDEVWLLFDRGTPRRPTENELLAIIAYYAPLSAG